MAAVSVAAADPQDQPVTASATKTILAGQTAQLTVTKTATPDRGVGAGSTIRYTIAATNTGTVTLRNVLVADPMAGLAKLVCSPRLPTTVPVGATVRCTATAVITPADVIARTLRNTATAVGLDPVDNPTEARGSASVDTSASPPAPPAPPTPPPSTPGSNSRGSGAGGSGSGRSTSGDTGSNSGTAADSGTEAADRNATSDDRFVTSPGARRAHRRLPPAPSSTSRPPTSAGSACSVSSVSPGVGS